MTRVPRRGSYAGIEAIKLGQVRLEWEHVMDNLKSYLITRLLAVMGAVVVIEIIVLTPVRRILLPIAAHVAQMETVSNSLRLQDIIGLLYIMLFGRGEGAVLGVLGRSQIFLLLLAIGMILLAPPAGGVMVYAWLVARRVNELEEQREKESEAYSAKRNRMFSDFAHDLRTPITTIAGYAGALSDGMVKEPAQQKEYLEAIRRKSERMSELINLLFDYVKLGSTDYKLNKKDCDVNALVAEIAASLYTDMEEAGMELIADIPETPFVVNLDRSQAGRLINNLLINAMRHNPSGTKIAVSVKRIAGAELLAVADSGVPIEGQAAKLFEPFVKGDKSRSGDRGSGLGLSICKMIADMHGWSIGLAQPYEGYTKAFVVKITED